MPSALEAHIVPARRLSGRLRVPGDKSISHRYALLSALAAGTSRITNYSPGADCAATLECLRALGVTIHREADAATGRLSTIVVEGRGLGRLAAPTTTLDAQNSGTTTRLLAGILAAHPFTATITGDDSLRRRPMKRVIDPLTRMGARIEAVNGCAPLTITGGGLHPIEYTTPVPSAQIKSAVLLAGLHLDGRTTVHEAAPTRDHTELAVAAFGGHVECAGTTIHVHGGRPLHAVEAEVPGDVSSATFWAVAAAALPGSDVTIEDLGLNPSRTALFDVLARAGAQVDRVVDAQPAGRAARQRAHPPRGTCGRWSSPPTRCRRSSTSCRRWPPWRPRGRTARHRRGRAARQGERPHLGARRGPARARGRHRRVPGRLPHPRRPAAHRRACRCGHDHRLAMAFAIAGAGGQRPDDDDAAPMRWTSRTRVSSTSWRR